MQQHVQEVHWPADAGGGIHHVVPEAVIDTPVVTAHAIVLRPGAADAGGAGVKKRAREGEGADPLPPPGTAAPVGLAMMYVCKVVSKRGKFLKDKAVALGVTPCGPALVCRPVPLDAALLTECAPRP